MTEFQPTVIGAQIHGRRRPLRGMVLCLLAGFSVMALPFVEHAMLYAIVLSLLVCLIGPLAYSWFRNSLDYFESIHVFGFIYFVYFGLGAVWTVNDPSFVAYDIHIVPYIPRAAFYCLLGYLGFIVAYYGPWSGRIDRRATFERMRGPQYMILIAGLGMLGFLGVAAQERNVIVGGGVTPVIGSLTQLAPLFFCAWALGWLLFFSDQDTRAQRWVLLGLLVPGALFTAVATTGDKSLLIELIGIPIVARWYSGKKIPWTTLIVLLLLLVFVVFPFYNTYRWSDPTMRQVDRATVTYERIQTWDSSTYYLFSVGSFTRRLAMINSVGVVVRDVGRWTPYARGRTIFMPILVQFIPRVVWPDKPVGSMGRDFGRLFRVTNTFTKDTHIGVTTPGELYWNFGLPGVIAGMALVGFLLRWLYRRYGEGQVDPIRRAIHILLIIQIAHLGASMAGDLVVMVRTLIVLEGVRWLGRRFGWLEVVDREAGDGSSGPSQATLPAGS